jgi:XRE family transcriptional regulator, regulator of sulfur utilization
MGLGDAIVTLRKKKNMLQKDLAAKANISSPHLSLIEQDKTDVNMKTLAAIAEALDVPLPILFFKSMSDEDVPENKRDNYGMISSMINGLVDNTFLKDSNK